MAAKKKGAGGSLTRSQVVTVRLDPKLKFAAELAARKQRRTISSFIEWAVEKAVRDVEVLNNADIKGTVWQAMMLVWDVEEADRLVKLALNFPELLTFDEERLWKIICEHAYFWHRNWNNGGDWMLIEDDIKINNVREQWGTLNKIISNEANISDIPEGEEEPPSLSMPPSNSGKDVPF